MKTPTILLFFSLCVGTSIGYNITEILCSMRDSRVTTLNLHNFKLTHEDMVTIAAAIKGTTITKLDLARNNLGEEGTKVFANSFKNSTITVVYFYENGVGDRGAVALATVLEYTKIAHLELGMNGIGDEGASAIARVLKDTRITTLDLFRNKIGNQGARALATGLIGSRMNDLSLWENRVGDDGAKAIADSLNKTGITELTLKDNPVGYLGEQALAEAIKGTGVTYFHHDCLSVNARRKIDDALSRNKMRIERLYQQFDNFVGARNGSLKFNTDGALADKSDYIEFVRIIERNKPVYRLRFIAEGRTNFTAVQIEDFLDNIEKRLEDCFRTVLVVRGFRDFVASKNGSLEFVVDHAHTNESGYIELAGIIARNKSFYGGLLIAEVGEDYVKKQILDFVENVESRVMDCLRKSKFMYQQFESFLVTKDERLEFYINYTIPRKVEYLNFTIVILKDEQGWMNYFISKGTGENWSYLVKDFFENIHQRLIEFFGRIRQV